MKNCYILDFRGSFIKNEIVNEQHDNIWKTNKVSPYDYLSTEGLDYLKKIKIIPHKLINLFIGPPCFSTVVHTDSVTQSYAINYVWNSTLYDMSWYNTTSKGYLGKTTANTDFIKYNEQDVIETEKISNITNQLMLVRIDIPHSVSNYANTNRYCISIRGYPNLSWEKIVVHLKDHIIC